MAAISRLGCRTDRYSTPAGRLNRPALRNSSAAPRRPSVPVAGRGATKQSPPDDPERSGANHYGRQRRQCGALAGRALRSAAPAQRQPIRLCAGCRPPHPDRPLAGRSRRLFGGIDHRGGGRGAARRRRSRRRPRRSADAVERRRQLHQHAVPDQGRAFPVPDPGQHARRFRRGKPVAIPDGPGGRAGVAGDGGDLPAHRAPRGGGADGRCRADHGVSGRQRGRRVTDPEAARRQGVLTLPRYRPPPSRAADSVVPLPAGGGGGGGGLNPHRVGEFRMANDYPQGVDMAAAIAAGFVLDRREAVPKLIGRHEDFLFVTGLAGTARDIAALTQDGAHIYTMAGAMGGACMIGLGLALARPDKRVLVATGDGELLMNLGALATIAVLNPANLALLCVDNGHYGETGYQKSHTSLGVDLERIAAGSGIKRTRTVASEADLAEGARMLREGNGTAFVVLKVKPDEPPS